MCFSEKIPFSAFRVFHWRTRNSRVGSVSCHKAFSLIETVAALAILALICLSVLVVIDRCMASMADSELRMQAFDIARDNMEKLLALDSAKEIVEYGVSEKNAEIEWQTVVETFYEPATSRMWVRAICSAQYTDMAGEVQTVELTHWLTNLTKKQVIEILKQGEKQRLANQVFGTVEEAAEQLGVDEAAIQQWIDNGMRVSVEGGLVRSELELYRDTGGSPTIDDRRQRVAADRGLDTAEPGAPETTTGTDDTGLLIAGYTMAELEQMPFEQVWEILSNWNPE